MDKLKIYKYSTLVLALILAAYLINSIKFSIDEEARISNAEEKIINKLKMIRNAQIAFQNVNGKYTDNWDSLINFVDSGKIFIIQRREETTLLEYGAEETVLYLDTLGSVSVMDSLFSNYPKFISKNLKNVPGYENVFFEKIE